MYKASRVLFFLTAVSLFTPTFTSRIHRDSTNPLSLLGRGFSESEPDKAPNSDPRLTSDPLQEDARHPSVEEIVDPEQEPIERPPILLDVIPMKYSYALQRLQKLSEDGKAPVPLYEVYRSGKPVSKVPVDVRKELANIREVRTPGGLELYEIARPKITVSLPNNKDGSKEGQKIVRWDVEYYSKRDVNDFEGVMLEFLAQGNLPMLRSKNRLAKRATGLTSLLDGNPIKDATTTQSNQFELYLTALIKIESQIATLISPVLRNFTAQTNSVYIHDMAQSIFYDLTGSTTTLAGPFKFGVSFLGNLTVPAPGQNATGPSSVYAALEALYAGMWVEAMIAANSTGLLPRHALLIKYLSTNDTALYPPGYTTVPKGHTGDDTQL